jgi:hypothetical protein
MGPASASRRSLLTQASVASPLSPPWRARAIMAACRRFRSTGENVTRFLGAHVVNGVISKSAKSESVFHFSRHHELNPAIVRSAAGCGPHAILIQRTPLGEVPPGADDVPDAHLAADPDRSHRDPATAFEALPSNRSQTEVLIGGRLLDRSKHSAGILCRQLTGMAVRGLLGP